MVTSVASSVDVLSKDERLLVVSGLEALIAAAERGRSAAIKSGDAELADLRSKRIAVVSSLAAKFR